MKNEEIKSAEEILKDKVGKLSLSGLKWKSLHDRKHLILQAMEEYSSQFITSKDKEIEASRNTLLEEIKVLAKKNSDLRKYIQTLEEGWIDQIKVLQKENQTLKTAVGNLEMLLDGDGLKHKQTIEKLTERWDDMKKWIVENTETIETQSGSTGIIIWVDELKQKIMELQNKLNDPRTS